MLANSNKAKQSATISTVSTPTAVIADATPRASLLGIPPELRNQIYQLVIISEEEIEIKTTAERNTCRRRLTMTPPLTMALRQLRNETLRMFFEENKFTISDPLILFKTPESLHTFATMCAGSELRSVRVAYTTRVVRRQDMSAMLIEITVVITDNELQTTIKAFSRDRFANMGCRTLYIPPTAILGADMFCGCGIDALAGQSAGQKGTITRLLDALGPALTGFTIHYPSCGSESIRRAEFCDTCPGRKVKLCRH